MFGIKLSLAELRIGQNVHTCLAVISTSRAQQDNGHALGLGGVGAMHAGLTFINQARRAGQSVRWDWLVGLNNSMGVRYDWAELAAGWSLLGVAPGFIVILYSPAT
jgi:hypothetical protein